MPGDTANLNARFTGRRRLLAAARFVPGGSRVADVGSGHGLLARVLLATGRASHCIATERTEETLAAVRPLPPGVPFAEHLELRHGDGLSVLRPEDAVDVALLLGMGTRTMLRILDQPGVAELGISRFILQPQTEWAGLRKGLLERGLAIDDERLVRDRGRIYLIVVASRATAPSPLEHPDLTREDLLETGPCLVASRDPLLVEVWRREYARRERIAQRAVGAEEQHSAEAARTQARRILDVLEGPAENGTKSTALV